MKAFESLYNPGSERSKDNQKKNLELIEELNHHLQNALSEGPEKYTTRHKERGKLLARERIQLLLDPDSPFLELMPLAGLGQDEMSLGGSVISGIGLVNGVECLINANIPTKKGGALNEMSVLKSARLDEIAMENRLPVIYLTESAGADLTQQARIFNRGGKAFREISRRSKAGIPSLTAVFGSSTAGGAYIPGMSDYVVMVKDQAKAYLAGPPLVKMAINEEVDHETLGGAEMHSKVSGLSDYMANDEREAIGYLREIIAQIGERKTPKEGWEEPLYSSEDFLGLVGPDIKIPFEVREVISRLVDSSRFFEFKPMYGPTLVTCFATMFGQKVGIIANNGVLFSDAANKGAHFIQLCNRQNIPLIFLQNITGFMVGKDAEQSGIIKNGAKLINAVANSEVPAITIMMGASYGAGNYGMCGRAYAPRFLFSWPHSKLAVMGPDQLVGVLEILQEQKAQKQGALSVGKLLDKGKNKIIKETLRKRIEEESSVYYGTSRLFDDAVIDPRDTRTILGICLSVISNEEEENKERSNSFGVWRL